LRLRKENLRSRLTPGSPHPGPAPARACPLGINIPTLGGLTAVAQLAFIQWQQLLLGLVVLGAGSAIYLLRNRYHQPEQHAELQRFPSGTHQEHAPSVAGRSSARAASAQHATP
jgi:hypothetical protein